MLGFEGHGGAAAGGHLHAGLAGADFQQAAGGFVGGAGDELDAGFAAAGAFAGLPVVNDPVLVVAAVVAAVDFGGLGEVEGGAGDGGEFAGGDQVAAAGPAGRVL